MKTNCWYILDEDKNVVVLPEGVYPSAEDFRKNHRVAETTLSDGKWVSTVFLGLDHNWDGGPPLVFETMVFPSHEDFSDLYCERYSTYGEALAGHQKIVDECNKLIKEEV